MKQWFLSSQDAQQVYVSDNTAICFFVVVFSHEIIILESAEI